MNVLIDTNLLIRSVSQGDKNCLLANDAIIALINQGEELRLVPQNLYEFWVVATRPTAQNGLGRSPDEALAEISYFKTRFVMHGDIPTVFDEWEKLIAAYKVVGKPAHDARLVAAMLVHGVTHILTFNDKDFRRYPQITVLTPAGVVSSAGGP